MARSEHKGRCGRLLDASLLGVPELHTVAGASLPRRMPTLPPDKESMTRNNVTRTHRGRFPARALRTVGGAAALAAALIGSSPANAADPQIPFERYQLDNGIEIILHQDTSTPIVAVNVWYHVGSGDEMPGNSGFAHLFEHMLFQGSQHVGQDRHFEVLKSIGASTVNGTTSPDRTNYFEVVPSHQLETALWLESDRMGYLLPMLNRDSLDNQIDVVRNERRQSVDNVPYGTSQMELAAALYPEGHPYRYRVIGKHEDIAAATVDDVVAFYRKWYSPANATIVVAGDFETAAVKAALGKWFGTFPKLAKPERRPVAVPRIQRVRKEVPDPLAKLPQLTYAWHTPPYLQEGDAELDILANVLASRTGRLQRLLVDEQQVAQEVQAWQTSQQRSSYFSLVVTLKPNADLAAVEATLADELARVVTTPVSQREFDRAVTNLESRFVWGLEPLMARAEYLQRYNHFYGDPDGVARDIARYRQSSPAKVQSTAAAFLRTDQRVEIITKPVQAVTHR
ncbi:MAG: insulinase family protein [Myxococcales bacterium FL481]|nr:MAG: insulinase family protein [Myxococcales bacterium FL481]